MSGTPASDEKVTVRILLVEDNEIARQLISDYFTALHYDVVGLADATDFFVTLAQFQPHLILLDLKLPKVDGYTLLQQLQQHCEWQHIPVIILSAHAFKAYKERAMALGARQYLTKPVGLDSLTAAVQHELRYLS